MKRLTKFGNNWGRPENKELHAKVMTMIMKMSASEIARQLGFKRQWIHQIIQMNGGYPDGAVRRR